MCVLNAENGEPYRIKRKCDTKKILTGTIYEDSHILFTG